MASQGSPAGRAEGARSFPAERTGCTCHLQDAYVPLQDFFLGVVFGRDNLGGHGYALALVIDQHILRVVGVPGVTCKHRICSLQPSSPPRSTKPAVPGTRRLCSSLGLTTERKNKRAGSIGAGFQSHFGLKALVLTAGFLGVTKHGPLRKQTHPWHKLMPVFFLISMSRAAGLRNNKLQKKKKVFYPQ